MSKIVKNSTFFVDIDGTLVKYRKFKDLENSILEPISDVVTFINDAHKKGCHIVITTARPEPYRNFTISELNQIGLNYDQLVMGIGRGTRIIINDKDPENPNLDRAVGLNLERNHGFKNMDISHIIESYESD